MLVLGIESTCDETGASLVLDGETILSNVIASSADLHEKYGGVFPELACRRHIDCIDRVIDEAIQKAGVSPDQIDLIAVANRPGLVGALLIGVMAAKGLSIAWQKPLIGINHVEAHLYAAMMGNEVPLPALGAVLSGGHTFLVRIEAVGKYELLATTVDDAIGEAFDKVARILELPYPGGPFVEKLAKEGNPNRYPLKAGFVKKSPLDFSFSGLKTSVLYTTEKEPINRADLAASFQETAFGDIVRKMGKASQSFPCQSIVLGGGVSANERLREMVGKRFQDFPVFFPPKSLALDNAAMIAGLAAKKYAGKSDSLEMPIIPRNVKSWNFDKEAPQNSCLEQAGHCQEARRE